MYLQIFKDYKILEKGGSLDSHFSVGMFQTWQVTLGRVSFAFV